MRSEPCAGSRIMGAAVSEPCAASVKCARSGPAVKFNGDSEELTHLSARRLVELMKRREVTAVEVVQAHIRRIEQYDEKLNAFITTRFDQALQEAEEADRWLLEGHAASLLHGVPIAVMDIFMTRGIRTTWGSQLFKDYVPPLDCEHVTRARSAGAIIIGKTNTAEFGYGMHCSSAVGGVTCNPHMPQKSSGGSSGGSAAAVAAGMVCLADGSDGCGSLRLPAAWCGVVGFRPSSGMIPLEPNALPFDGLRVPGAFARCVEDVALFMEVVAGPSQSAPLHAASDPEPFHNQDPMLVRGVRVAWDPCPCGSSTDAAVSTVLQQAIARLAEHGCTISNACPKLDNAVAATRVFRNVSAAVECGQHVREARSRLSPTIVQVVRNGSSHAVADIIDAQQAQAECWNQICEFFDSHDAIIWPTSCALAVDAQLSETDYMPMDWRPTELTAALQLPAITLPVGRSACGMPVGMQIIAPRGRDAKLLRFAAAVEAIIGYGPAGLPPGASAAVDGT